MLVVAARAIGDEALVDQALLDDRVQHGVEQRDVGVRLELQVMRRVARELRAARVGEDELRAALDRVLDPRRGDRVIDDRIGADQKAPPRPASRPSPDSTPRPSRCLRAAPRRSRRGTAACSGRRCSSRSRCARASGTGTPPRSSPWPSRSRRARGCHAHRGCASACRRRAPAPRPSSPRGTPTSASAGSIVKSADLRHAGLADQRPRQALRVMRVVEAEAALDAQPVVIGRAVAALDADDRGCP